MPEKEQKSGCFFGLIPTVFIILIGIVFLGNIINAMPILAVEELFSITGDSNEEMTKWSEELDEMSVDALDEQGISVHPRKVKDYVLIENKSIPQDSIIKRKVWTKVSKGRQDEWLDTTSEPERYEYKLELWDVAYPYRLFKQAVVGVDVIDDTSNRDYEKELLTKAEKKVYQDGLGTAFDWSFEYKEQQDMENGKTYYEIDDDSFQYEKTIWESRYKRKRVTKNGSVVENTNTQTDYRYSYPLPYPNYIKTMFKNYEFEYKKEVLEDTGWIKEQPYPKRRSWSVTYEKCNTVVIDEAGNTKKICRTVTDHYTSTTWIETRKKVEKDVLVSTKISDNYNFFSFLINNQLDTEADPYLIYELAQVISNDNTFTELLAESLNIQPDTDYASPGVNIDIEDLNIPEGRFLRPCDMKYPVTSKFGYRIHPTLNQKKFHNGLDIGAPLATPVYAAAPGKVVYAGRMGSYGNIVIINHSETEYEGFETYYAHLNTIYVKKGDTVVMGQNIAGVGSTGRSTGPHLHFEIRYQNNPLNPQLLIAK